MINYYLLTKPRIILGNLVTVAAGFLLASKGTLHAGLFLATLLGLACIIASACVFNNYIDVPLDKKMARTKNRPLVLGLISGKHAIVFATLLLIIGNGVLFYFTNLLTVIVAASGFFFYVVPYSLWKSRTIYGTAIGSIAGAVPPLVGYCAVSGRFDLGALILFAILILWQMPHFYSIALYHLEDYKAAQMPLLPIEKGSLKTKIHMTIYIFLFIAASSLLTLFNYTGYFYLSAVGILGICWLVLSFRGFKEADDKKWGGQMFRLSLIIIAVLSFAIPFDTI